MTTLREQLNAVGYRLTESLEARVLAALRTRPCAGCFLVGPAGAGKTFLAESLAGIGGFRTYFFQAFPGCRKEELYQTILPDASQPSGFRTQVGVLPHAADASHQGPTALILDEWDKTHPSTDAFLLDFLQNGRVSVPGSEIQANLENLVVFVTLNVERELSEPLLRRLPLIELAPPPANLVAQALQDSHPDNAYIPAAVALYQRSQLVNMSKPATIQELRQLLDAVTELGPRADWNELVFQFITKSWDDHELLKSAEDLPLLDPQRLQRDRPRLDPAHYEPAALEGSGDPLRPELPRIQRDWLERMPAREVLSEAAQIYGVVPRSDAGYDGVARALLSRVGPEGVGEDPADLRIAEVGEAEIIVFEALDFERMEEWGQILRDGGELLLEARHRGEVSPRMLLDFKAGVVSQHPNDPDRCRIYSLTHTEMLMRYRNLKVRWTPEVLEVVTRDFNETRELWDFLYGPRGAVVAGRRAMEQIEARERGGEEPERPAIPPNEQIREDYLFVLRDFRHLREWFSLLINRNLRVWGKVTAKFRNLTVVDSILPAAEFLPENESPATKEEAEAIAVFNELTQAAMDYYESHVSHIESELHTFVAKNGEFPPAVEDGGIFGLQEVHTDLNRIKREGLKLYMRKQVHEA